MRLSLAVFLGQEKKSSGNGKKGKEKG